MNSGAGVMCYAAGATPYIAGNLVSGNYGGFFIANGAEPILGAPEMNHPYAYGLNTIIDNIDVNGDNNSVVMNGNNPNSIVLAKNNFWGTTVTSEIDETITDNNDNSSLGTVVYLPLASEITEYTLTINLTSEIEGNADYRLHVRDLSTLEVTAFDIASLDQPLVITFESPVDITLYGSFEQDGEWHYGHCYYGPFDQPYIVSLNDDNTSQEIYMIYYEAPRPKTFRTYLNVEVNGIDATPILKDEFYTDQVKQLIYENDNNELMLVGYQKYGPNGWETVALDEDLLYLKNDAQVGDTFTNHQVSFIDGQYTVYSNSCQVVGSYFRVIQNINVNTKVLHKILDSPWDMETTAMIEYSGNISPLSVNPRTANFSDYLATSEEFFGPFNQQKLLTFQQEVEVDYQTETSLIHPTNLRLLGEDIYWNPCSFIDHGVPGSNLAGYDIYIDSANSEDLEYYHVGLAQTSLPISLLDLPAGESNIWVCGRNSDGENTSPTNTITINIVSNEVNDIASVTSLLGNYPNPFNPETSISYNLKTADFVLLDVYNIKGQKVKTLVNEYKETGNHNVVWNGTDDANNNVASGLYFYKMKSGKYTSTKKMILMK
ncbi:T9SS type A sorting domain-containing protein [bacterium]|nr:T9SS type A sorting domain-containing protein [bacterium]